MVAVMPATGVRWSEPSRRGSTWSRSPRPRASWPRCRAIDGAAPGEVHVGHPERRRQRLRVPGLGRALVAEARLMAQVGIAGGVDEHGPVDPDQPGLGGHHDVDHAAVPDGRRLDECVEQGPGTRGLDEVAPDHLEVRRQIRDPGPGPEGVRPRHDGTQASQTGDDLVRDAAHDLARLAAGQVEAVEGIEHRRARAAERGQLLDEHDRGTLPGCGDGRARPRGTGTDHHDIGRGDDGWLSRPPSHAGAPHPSGTGRAPSGSYARRTRRKCSS